MGTGTYSDLLRALGQNESGNNYSFVSSVGYLGRFQFGEEALKAIGFYQGDHTWAIDFLGGWTEKAHGYGVWDKAGFLASPAAQDAAQAAWFQHVHDDLRALDLLKYDGQWVAGSQVTVSGLLAGAHLVGVWNLKSFLESGGSVDTRDPYGTPVSQYVSKFGGYDTVFGGAPRPPETAGGSTAGNDSLVGAPGPNVLRGHDGDDSLMGHATFDDLQGNAGNDTVVGAEGGDWVVGGRDQDRLDGGTGDDVVLGNLGQDTCEGGAGNDIVRGGQGDDIVRGGDGDDWVAGDRGSDTVSGGAGADVFHFFADAGADLVLDFRPWEGDRVDVLAGEAYWVSQAGADVVVAYGSGAQLTLAGVQLSALPEGWIF